MRSMSQLNVWKTSVGELVQLTCEALRALVPIAEKAYMPWREPANYDDWDEMAQAIYNSIVIRSVQFATETAGFAQLPAYDRPIADYSGCSFVTEATQRGRYALLSLASTSMPFDTGHFTVLDATGKPVQFERILLSKAKLLLAGRSGNKLA